MFKKVEKSTLFEDIGDKKKRYPTDLSKGIKSTGMVNMWVNMKYFFSF